MSNNLIALDLSTINILLKYNSNLFKFANDERLAKEEISDI